MSSDKSSSSSVEQFLKGAASGSGRLLSSLGDSVTTGSKPERSGLSVRSKLLLMLLASTLVTIAVIGYMGDRAGKLALTKTFSERLISIRNAKKQEVEEYFRSERATFGILGNDVAVAASLNSFKQGVGQLNGFPPLAQDELNKLTAYYENEFLPRARNRTGEELRIEEFMPATSIAQKLQSLYIADNPFSVGEKDRLSEHPSSSLYALTHGIYHDWYRDIAKRMKLYDVFLINPDGQIVYSVFKETDFGTDLIRGPHRDSNLARLFREVMKEKKRGDVKISDFAFYGPSYFQAAAFIAVPVYSNWKFQGVIAAQLSVTQINALMSNKFDWKSGGLGKTGEAFLVGENLLMRSDSRRRYEDQDAYLKSLKALNTPADTVRRIEVRKSSILLQRVGTEQVKAALEGKTGTKRIEGYQGNAVLSSYTPLDIPGLNWALIAEISEDEALADQRELRRNVLLVACLLSILTTIAALLAASQFLKPVYALIQGIDTLKQGGQDAKVPKFANDEFGELTDAFNDMSSEIKDRNDVIQSKSRAYEALLRSIFPDAVADRLKSGDSQIVETVSDATVVYLTLHGFTGATEQEEGEQAIRLLNELVDMIDLEAEKQGVEKVKTMGEHYLAVCGLSTPRLDHVERSLKFVELVSDELSLFNKQHNFDLTMRAGIASGRVRAGIVGQKKFVYDVWGRPSNIARRIVYGAGLNCVRITAEVYEQLRQPEQFTNPKTIETQTLGDVETYEMSLVDAEHVAPVTDAASASKASKAASTDKRRNAKAVAAKTASTSRKSSPKATGRRQTSKLRPAEKT